MLSTSTSATLSGVSALKVTVEANSGEKGDPKCVLVGLPDASVKESMDRVFSSIGNAGFSKPRTHVTINLAPGDLRKEGAAFDLPIALALLHSTGQIQCNGLNDFLVAGELALSGEVRKVKGGLAMAILAKEMGKKGVLLPRDSALRQPLEDGEVTISRSAGKVTLPCRFMLVAAMNPCPCGYLGDQQNTCRCSMPQIQKYRSKISGPLMDRIDIHIETPAVKIEELQESKTGEGSTEIRERVEACRDIQKQRYFEYGLQGFTNASIPQNLMDQVCAIGRDEKELIKKAINKLSLSARAYNKILKVARTIADLDASLNIEKKHLLEAIQYRSLDRN
ncbi:MAG: ATP-binding protein, partial [Opitutae bacterium]|nr:ATP-binding protein [Opitutae bacterium]